MEACARIRDRPSCFCVHLNDLYIAFKVCVVDKIAVGLSVLRDKHIKVLHQLSTFPAFCLMDGINAVRHILCLTKAVFITDDNITLIGIGVCIAASGFQVDFKFCSFFGCFNLCFPIVGVLNQGDIALDNLLDYIV